MLPEHRKIWYTLSRCKGMKAQQLRMLMNTNEPHAILQEEPWQNLYQQYLEEFDYVAQTSADFVLAGESAYPENLLELADAPTVLWYRGDPDLLKAPQIGVVGARTASLNTQNFVKKTVQSLGTHGYVITSGFARGIDAAAHEAALTTGTIAVLGCGVDIIYPQQNARLFDQILSNSGLIISEFPLGTPPKAQNFPRRNRIIAALSQAILVAEAGLQSGSLITARLGNELGKDIYVIPGFPEDPRFAGSIELLKQGAAPFSCVSDIVDNVFQPFKPQAAIDPMVEALSPAHRSLLELLSFTPTPIDDLVGKCQTSMDVLGQLISELELSGRVMRTHNHELVLTR